MGALLVLAGMQSAYGERKIDRDLMEVSIPQLAKFYRSHKYTVLDVVSWYLARIAKYNPVYGAVENVDPAALELARQLDAEAKSGGKGFVRGALWGVPIVIKANTSIKGLITSDGFKGYLIRGKELIAPKDATISKLKAAGAVILGQTYA